MAVLWSSELQSEDIQVEKGYLVGCYECKDDKKPVFELTPGAKDLDQETNGSLTRLLTV